MFQRKLAEGMLKRFQEILDDLDELSNSEEMDELNAQYEDTLFLAESIGEEDDDAEELFAGTLEELNDLLTQYRALHSPQVDQKIVEMEMAVKMAERNL